MKTRILTSSLILLACAAAMPALAKGPNNPSSPQSAARTSVTVPALSAEEADTLLWMREDELFFDAIVGV